jgi:ATP-binding cassette, subfamily B, bacterial PglK
MYHKLKKILSKKQLNLVYLFVFLSLITMMLELIGLGLIIPFIKSLMSDGADLTISSYLNKFNLFPETKNELILIFIIFISIIYTIKTLYLTFFSYAQTKLLADLRVNLSDKIYNIYLNKPYEFHLNHNSSKLIRNIDEVSLVVALIQFIITASTEFIIFLGIASFVIWYEPLGAVIIILFFGFFGFLFFNTIKQRVKKWGEMRQAHSGLRLKFLNEGFRLIKYAKILQKTKELIQIYTNNNKILNLCEIKQNFTDSLPRLWLEWLIVIAFTLVIFVMIYIGRDIQYILPLIGLFVAAAFRIMPSLTRIMNCIQKIIYNRPALDTIYFEFEKNEINPVLKKINLPPLSFNDKISLKDIKFKYNHSNQYILKNLNLEINQGDTIGIVGESGKGKTTLINIILGLLKPTEGKVTVDKENIFENLENWQKKIGYVSQDIFLTDDTIKKNIAFGLNDDLIDKQKIQFSIKNSKLEEFIKNLDNGLSTKIGEFGDRISGGQRQRIAIARAFYNNPEVLILDEFTNSLDNTTEEKIINELSSFKGKRTLIIIAHRLSTLKNCDHIYKLDNGSIKKET